MSDSLWISLAIGDCLSTSFAGEWGSDPRPGNAVVLRATDIDNDGNVIGQGAARAIPKSKLLAKALQHGDILLEGSGGGPGKPVGRVAFFDVATHVKTAICSNFFKTLRPNPVHFDSRFLWRKLGWFYTQPSLLSLQQQTTGIINLKFAEYLTTQLRFPVDTLEQAKIAEVLDAIDNTIRQTEAIIEKLKLVKQGLLHDLLTRGIDANGQLRPPQSHAPHLYKHSPLGWIPIEWCAMPLGKLASLQRGHDIVESNFILGPYPVISSSGVIGYHNVATARGPNVIVGRKGSIGTVHFVETDFWAHDTSLFVTNFFGNDQRFVFHLFDFMQLGQYGTKSGSPSLNRNDLHPKLVGRPSLGEQRGIVGIISAYSERLTKSIHERAKLRQLKSGLMDDLLTGRVRVTPLLEAPSA